MSEEKNAELENDSENELFTETLAVEEPLEITSYETIEQINFRLSEIAVIFDEYDHLLFDEDKKMMSDEEYEALKNEEKELRDRKKELKKSQSKDGFWDKIKIWMIVYAIVQFLICMPWGGLYQLTYATYETIISWIGTSMSNAPVNFQGFVQIMALLAFPILNVFLSWLLFAYVVKTKFDKKVFAVIWGSQFLLTTISMLIVLL